MLCVYVCVRVYINIHAHTYVQYTLLNIYYIFKLLFCKLFPLLLSILRFTLFIHISVVHFNFCRINCFFVLILDYILKTTLNILVPFSLSPFSRCFLMCSWEWNCVVEGYAYLQALAIAKWFPKMVVYQFLLCTSKVFCFSTFFPALDTVGL